MEKRKSFTVAESRLVVESIKRITFEIKSIKRSLLVNSLRY